MIQSVSILMAALLMPVADDMPNPQYESWKNFKVGTKLVMETNVEQPGGQGMKSVMTTVLKSLDENEAVIEMSSVMHVAGQKIEQPAQAQKIPARIPKPPEVEPAPEDPKVKTEKGDEEVEVAGTKYACERMKTTSEFDGQSFVSTVWTCSKIPGGMVKMVSESSGVKTTMSITELTLGK